MVVVPHLFLAFWNGLKEKHATEGKSRTPARLALTGQISLASVRPVGNASPWAGPLRYVPFTWRGLQTDSEDVFKIQRKGQVSEPLPSQFSLLAFRGKAGQP